MQDIVEVSAMGRSPELYIEPFPQTVPSRGLAYHTPQVPATAGSLHRMPGFLESTTGEVHRKVPFFELATLHWSRSLKMPTSFADLNIVGGAQLWTLIVAFLVLVWVARVVNSAYTLELPINMSNTNPISTRPSKNAKEAGELIQELESAVHQSTARLPRGLQRKEG